MRAASFSARFLLLLASLTHREHTRRGDLFSMRCLTYSESEGWFAAIGAEITKYRYISFQHGAGRPRLLLPALKLDVMGASSLATHLVDWLPSACERMLWLSNWETYPPDQTILFETVRRGCGETRHIIDAPGHLFQSSAYDRNDYDTRTPQDHEENGLLWGLLLLMITFNWDGYLVTPNGDCISLADTSIAIFSDDDAKIDEAYKIADVFNLKFQEQRS
jgi:hypothetical protein